MEKLYSTNEVAIVLNVTTRTIRRWKKAGKLCPRTSQLGQDYYAEEDIRTFIRTNQLGQGENVLTNIEIILGQLGHTEDIKARTSRTQDTIRTLDRTLGQEEKNKAAQQEADKKTSNENINDFKKNDNKKNKKSQTNFDEIDSLKRRKNRDNYEAAIRRRKELTEQAKPHHQSSLRIRCN